MSEDDANDESIPPDAPGLEESLESKMVVPVDDTITGELQPVEGAKNYIGINSQKEIASSLDLFVDLYIAEDVDEEEDGDSARFDAENEKFTTNDSSEITEHDIIEQNENTDDGHLANDDMEGQDETAESIELLNKEDHVDELGKFVFQLLPEHYVMNMQGRKSYKCDICGGTYRHAFSLKRHYLRNHVNYKYLSQSDISNCNIIIPFVQGVKDTPTNEDNLPAEPISPEQENKVPKLHQQPEQNESRENCPSKAIIMHGLYKCHTCSDLFDNVAGLKLHTQNHPDKGNRLRFPCTQCDMTFSHQHNLVRHMSVHLGEKPHNCQYCNKGFLTVTNQKRHERTHEVAKLYACQQCRSVFTSCDELNKHARKKHGINHHYDCIHCGKHFHNKELLEKHAENHTGSLDNDITKPFISATRSSNDGNLVKVEEKSETVTGMHEPVKENQNTCTNYSAQHTTHRSLCHHRRQSHSTKFSRSTYISPPNKLKMSIDDGACNKSNKSCSEEEFYANLANNISENLLHHVDGRLLEKPKLEDSNYNSNLAKYRANDNSIQNLPQKPQSDRMQDDEDIQLGTDNIPTAITENNCQKIVVEGLLSGSSNCSRDDMMYNLALSPASSNHVSGIQYVDGVLDLSLPHRERKCIGNNLADPASHFGSNHFQVQQPARIFVCYACGESMPTSEDMENHKINNHPNVYCTHLEVEGVKGIPLHLFKQNCSPVGLLGDCSIPTAVPSANPLICTKCQGTFHNAPDLHSHVLECAGHKDLPPPKYASRFGLNRFSRKYLTIKRGMKRKLELDVSPNKRFSSNLHCLKRPKKDDYNKIVTSAELSRPVSADYHNALMCDGCNRKFANQSALDRHEKSCAYHLKGKKRQQLRDIRQQHSCPKCRRSFTYLASLKKHCADKNCMKRKEKCSGKIAKIKSYLRADAISKKRTSGIKNPDGASEEVTKLPEENKIDEVPISGSSTAVAEVINEIATPINESMSAPRVANSGMEVQAGCEYANPITIAFPVEIKKELLDNVDEVPVIDPLENDTLSSPNIKVMNKSREAGFYSCPMCCRTYTYWANYNKHVHEACPLLERKDYLINSNSSSSSKKKRRGKTFNEDVTSKPNYEVEQTKPQSPIEITNMSEAKEEAKKATVVSEPSEFVNKTVESVGDICKEDHGLKIGRRKVQPYSCNICHTIFLSYVKLLQHQLSHKLSTHENGHGSDGKYLLCQLCDLQFPNLVALNKHISEHSKVKPDSPVLEASPPLKKRKVGGWPKGVSRKGYTCIKDRNRLQEQSGLGMSSVSCEETRVNEMGPSIGAALKAVKIEPLDLKPARRNKKKLKGKRVSRATSAKGRLVKQAAIKSTASSSVKCSSKSKGNKKKIRQS